MHNICMKSDEMNDDPELQIKYVKMLDLASLLISLSYLILVWI